MWWDYFVARALEMTFSATRVKALKDPRCYSYDSGASVLQEGSNGIGTPYAQQQARKAHYHTICLHWGGRTYRVLNASYAGRTFTLGLEAAV